MQVALCDSDLWSPFLRSTVEWNHAASFVAVILARSRRAVVKGFQRTAQRATAQARCLWGYNHETFVFRFVACPCLVVERGFFNKCASEHYPAPQPRFA